MPTYQYLCTECGHAFEQVQSFSDDALTHCPVCEGRLRKVFNAVGVVFKGSGFYRTDSRAGSASGSTSSHVHHRVVLGLGLGLLVVLARLLRLVDLGLLVVGVVRLGPVLVHRLLLELTLPRVAAGPLAGSAPPPSVDAWQPWTTYAAAGAPCAGGCWPAGDRSPHSARRWPCSSGCGSVPLPLPRASRWRWRRTTWPQARWCSPAT